MLCSRCFEQPVRAGGQRWCVDCHRKYQGVYRRKVRARTISDMNHLLSTAGSTVLVTSITGAGKLITKSRGGRE